MFRSTFGIAVIRHVPPCASTSSRAPAVLHDSTLGVSTTRSAITPAVSSLTIGMASSTDATVSVAPKNFAESRLNSTGSTAMTARAPAARAPCTALIPTPPVPMMTTVSPGCVPTPTVADPHPVVTPQDTSEAASNGIESSILITDSSASTAVFGEGAELRHRGQILVADVPARGAVGDHPLVEHHGAGVAQIGHARHTPSAGATCGDERRRDAVTRAGPTGHPGRLLRRPRRLRARRASGRYSGPIRRWLR